MLCSDQHHIGTCEFYSYHEKQLEQIEASDQNHCSQTENKRNQLGDIHELQNSNADSYVVSMFYSFLFEGLEQYTSKLILT